MPTQAFSKDECVVDRRRARRRMSERTTAKTTTAKGETSRTPSAGRKSIVKATPKNRIADVDAKAVDVDEPVERREKVERRGKIDPTTCERDYGADEVEFMKAMDDYKRRSGRMFPTWSEVLEVLRDLGYRKVAEQTQTYTGEE